MCIRDRLIDEIKNNEEVSFETRKHLSSKAFGHTAQYDTLIYNFLKEEPLTKTFSLTYEKHSEMRYGENPHQSAASYKIPGNDEPNVLNATFNYKKFEQI